MPVLVPFFSLCTFSIMLTFNIPQTDFGWKWFAPSGKEAFDKKRESELLNGRLAMCAVGGIATQSIINGHGFPYV